MSKRFVDGVCVYDGLWWALARPAVAVSIHLALAAAGTAVCLARGAPPYGGWASVVLISGLAAGWLLWTLVEYALHRWFLHHVRWNWLRRLSNEPFHLQHHSYRTMNDPDPRAVHPAITVPLALFLLGGTASASVNALPMAVSVGLLLGYVSYEVLHWLSHFGSPPAWVARLPYYKRLRTSHTVHHFRDSTRNYGFVTSAWDRVFGTFADMAHPCRPREVRPQPQAGIAVDPTSITRWARPG